MSAPAGQWSSDTSGKACPPEWGGDESCGYCRTCRAAIADMADQLEVTRRRMATFDRGASPWGGEATGDDLVDRLRGIYRSADPNGGPERRFPPTSICLAAAERILELVQLLAEASR